jgi:hypothetical protein
MSAGDFAIANRPFESNREVKLSLRKRNYPERVPSTEVVPITLFSIAVAYFFRKRKSLQNQTTKLLRVTDFHLRSPLLQPPGSDFSENSRLTR